MLGELQLSVVLLFDQKNSFFWYDFKYISKTKTRKQSKLHSCIRGFFPLKWIVLFPGRFKMAFAGLGMLDRSICKGPVY